MHFLHIYPCKTDKGVSRSPPCPSPRRPTFACPWGYMLGVPCPAWCIVKYKWPPTTTSPCPPEKYVDDPTVPSVVRKSHKNPGAASSSGVQEKDIDLSFQGKRGPRLEDAVVNYRFTYFNEVCPDIKQVAACTLSVKPRSHYTISDSFLPHWQLVGRFYYNAKVGKLDIFGKTRT